MFTVLVAECGLPQHSAADVLKQHFREECAVQRVRSSKEILSFLDGAKTDIILLDMNMPGITCFELSSLLRRSGQHCVLLPIADMHNFDHSIQPDDPAILDYLLRPYTDSELILTMEEALLHCRRQFPAHHTTVSTTPPREEVTKTDIIKKKIHQYILDHYSEIISMQDVAHAMNYSDTHFCRLFKQCFHMNFSVYLNDFRISQAKQLLTSTNQTVKDVGISCGYRDTSYFIRVFKRHTGMTPSDYRIHKLTMTAKKYNKS